MHPLGGEHFAHYLIERMDKTYAFGIRSVAEDDKPEVVAGVMDRQQPTAWGIVASGNGEGVKGPV